MISTEPTVSLRWSVWVYAQSSPIRIADVVIVCEDDIRYQHRRLLKFYSTMKTIWGRRLILTRTIIFLILKQIANYYSNSRIILGPQLSPSNLTNLSTIGLSESMEEMNCLVGKFELECIDELCWSLHFSIQLFTC